MPVDQELHVAPRREGFARDARQSAPLVSRAVRPARVRAVHRERGREIRMQPAKECDRDTVAQHRPNEAIPSIFARSQAIAVLDSRWPSGECAFPRADSIIDADVVTQNVATPAIVITGDHQDRRTRLVQIRERGKNPEARAWDHGTPLEPELEQIAVDHQRCRATLELPQKGERVAFHFGFRETEMQIRDDVARRGKHALSLASTRRLYKPIRSSHASPIPNSMTARSSTEDRCPPHEIEFRVRYAETDQMGVVYHTNYLVWCEMGRTDFIRARGMSYAQMERMGVSLAVSELSARYHAAARYDDLIRVRTSLAEIRSRMIVFDYLVSNAESGQRLVSARTTLVSLDESGKPVALPEVVRRLFDGCA